MADTLKWVFKRIKVSASMMSYCHSIPPMHLAQCLGHIKWSVNEEWSWYHCIGPMAFTEFHGSTEAFWQLGSSVTLASDLTVMSL